MSATPVLTMATLLARTSEGTRRMSARDPELGPKVRAALVMVSGRQTLGEMLALAGGLAHVLEAQLRTLLEKQLIVVVDPPGTKAAAEPVPVAAARLQILKRVEAAGTGLDEPAARIRAAANLGELTQRSHETAIAIQQAQGRRAAEEFWTHARAILLHWQGREAGARA